MNLLIQTEISILLMEYIENYVIKRRMLTILKLKIVIHILLEQMRYGYIMQIVHRLKNTWIEQKIMVIGFISVNYQMEKNMR